MRSDVITSKVICTIFFICDHFSRIAAITVPKWAYFHYIWSSKNRPINGENRAI